MNSNQFTCRFCLLGEGKSVNLFDHELILNVNLHSWINLTFGLKINETDNLPKNVCMSCILIVYQTYFFIRRCQESENALNQQFELFGGAESVVWNPPRNGTESNFARGGRSWTAAQSSSDLSRHVVVQSEGSSRVPLRSNDESFDSIWADYTSDQLLPVSDEQKMSVNNNALSEPCVKSFQQCQKTLTEKLVLKNSGDINLNYQRNLSDAQLTDIAEPKPCYRYQSDKSTCYAKTFQTSRAQRFDSCLHNTHTSNVQLASEDEECTSKLNVEYHKASKKQEQSSSITDDICIIEPIHDRTDKKSDFHLEFVKFLNSNISQPNSLLDMSKEMDHVHLQREAMLSQGVKPEEVFSILQGRSKEAKAKGTSHKMIKRKNPSSVDSGKVELIVLLDDDNRLSPVPPNSDGKVAHYSKNVMKSEGGHLANVCSSLEETVQSSTSVLLENNIKSVSTLKMLGVPLKEMDCVTLEQPSDVLSDSRFYSHLEQSPATSKDKKYSFFEKNTRGKTTNLESPVQQTISHPLFHLDIESGTGTEQHNKGHSCVKAERIMTDRGHSNGLCAVVGKLSKKKLILASPDVKGCNLEPECFQTTSNSPSRERKLLLSNERKSYQCKVMAPELDAFSSPMCNKMRSPNKRSFSHSDQLLQSILKENHSYRSLKVGNETFSNAKITTHFVDEITKCSRILDEPSQILQSKRIVIGDVVKPMSIVDIHKKSSIGENSNSRVFEGTSFLMEDENFRVQKENRLSLAHQIRNESQFLEPPCSLGESDVKTSPKKATHLKVDISSDMEINVTEKSQINSVLGSQFHDSKVTCDQPKSLTADVNSWKKATLLDGSNKDTSKKLFNHDAPSLPTKKSFESFTRENSFTCVSSEGIVQASNMLANASSFSKQSPGANNGKNYPNLLTKLTNKKPMVNNRRLNNKRKRIRKRKVSVSSQNLNGLSYAFPCPMCSNTFSKHEFLLKHLLTHAKSHTQEVEPFGYLDSNYSQLEASIPKSPGKLTEVYRSDISQQEEFESRTSYSIGVVRDEKIDEIRAIIQQHLIVNESGSLNSGCKSFRCPACFKFLPDWFEVTSHIVLKHYNLSSEWPMSFLFSPEIFRKLTGKYIDTSTHVAPIMLPPQQGIPFPQPLDICKHCSKQFSSKSGLLKHLIWAHNESLSDPTL